MASPDKALEAALAALAPLKDAGSGRSLLELQWIDQVRLQPHRAVFRLVPDRLCNSQRERIVSEARAALLGLEGLRMCRLN
jgi:ATP-binding protein involved in chromosome partitioning